MPKAKETKVIDASTEEKIKDAARIVFQKKGYAATRTRDIAEESNVNLALLNYYFRSKEKLFEIIMLETVSGFIQGMITVFDNEQTSFEEKIELLVENYINMGIELPDVPLFILSEIRNNPKDLYQKIPIKHLFTKSAFVRQFQEKVMSGEINEPNLLHFSLNLMSLIVFPLVCRPFTSAVGGLNHAEFYQLMQERKKLIPAWIKAMFYKS